jgi:hypothetical protein
MQRWLLQFHLDDNDIREILHEHNDAEIAPAAVEKRISGEVPQWRSNTS